MSIVFEHDGIKMPRCSSLPKRLLATTRQMISVRFFSLVTCISFTVSVVWIQFVDKDYLPQIDESSIQEALENVGRDYRYVNVYRKPDRLPKDTKYILLWTPQDYAPFYFLGNGQRRFLENNCSAVNCYVTDNRNFFGYGNLTSFDAIAFNGRNIDGMTRSGLPDTRYPHQKYIFFNMESADNYPICNELFDDFFNWTSTYRLDSDIPYPYILIRDLNGEVVGPKRNMHWIEELGEVDDYLSYRLQNKSKAAAWFVSHCSSRSNRNELVTQVQKALARYGMTVDVYGACGTMTCPIHEKANCDAILERDYYFYLSFENSFAEDYVTEKLLTALQHDAVPIVFGGANYTRFLPPGSYLDAKQLSPEVLAATMVALMNSPEHYKRYFRWRNHYVYSDPSELENVCSVCDALNDASLVERTSRYKQFRKWWHPYYKERCGA